jgi:hypothetical protein
VRLRGGGEHAVFHPPAPVVVAQRHRQLPVGDLDPQRVAALVQLGVDPQARAGPGRRDQPQDHPMGDQRPPSPFLVSTLTTGWPAAKCALACPFTYRNCASRSESWAPSWVLSVRCSVYPCRLSSRPTVSSLTWKPCAHSAPASWRVDVQVHRSGDSGSPRAAGSTSSSSAQATRGPARPAVWARRPDAGFGHAGRAGHPAPAPPRTRRARQPGEACHTHAAATTQHPGARAGQQAALLPGQVRSDQLVQPGQHGVDVHARPYRPGMPHSNHRTSQWSRAVAVACSPLTTGTGHSDAGTRTAGGGCDGSAGCHARRRR